MSTWIVIFMGEPSLRNPPQRRKSLIGRASIEFTGMVAAADLPFLLILHVVDESFQFLTRFTATHGLVSPAIFHEGVRSTAVLWRRGALPGNADRVPPGSIHRQGRFNPEVVNPAIAEIVFVGKPLHSAQLQIANPYLSGIRIEKHAPLSAQSVFTAADLKTVQMHIFPAKGDLQYVV